MNTRAAAAIRIFTGRAGFSRNGLGHPLRDWGRDLRLKSVAIRAAIIAQKVVKTGGSKMAKSIKL